MNPATVSAPDEPGVASIRRLEHLCDRFEAALQSGSRPVIEEYLAGSDGPDRSMAMRELLLLELAYRRRDGESPAPDDYRERFPEDRDEIDAAFAVGTGTEAGSSDRPAGGPAAGVVASIPGYVVREELGRGGMGVVFKAIAEPLNRFVALKMILWGDLAGPEAAARFRAEAEAVARLQHPLVVQIFRIGEHEGRPYLEMEYVEGGSLAARLDGRPRPPAGAARLVESLAEAVHHAHLRGIVHRDLKPANILLTADDIPKVTDFGLAKSLGADVGLTRTDSIIGSPSYMAPEQAGASAHRVGPATDVYSLGAILYELLTGRPPFRAATVLDTLEQVRSAEPAPPSRIQPGLPIDVETIVLKCLEKDPARRYAGADALAADLGRFRRGEPIVARPVGWLGRGFKWARRRPVTAGLMIVSAASTVLLILVLAKANLTIANQQRMTLGALRRERQVRLQLADANSRLADQQRRTEESLRSKSAALETTNDDLRRERRASYFQRIALADGARMAGQDGRADQLLDECPAEFRGWEWYYLKGTSSMPTTFVGHTDEVWDAVISPDGRRVASAGFDRTVRIWDIATGRLERTLLGHGARVYSVAFDKDGKRLVSASADRTAIIWDVATGRSIHVLRGHTDNVRCAVFIGNGESVYTGSWDGSVIWWDARSGAELRRYPAGVGWITRVALDSTNRWMAAGGTSGNVRVWEMSTESPIHKLEGRSGVTLSVAFSPDGWRVAASSNAPGIGQVKVWDINTGREILSYRVGSGLIERVTYSPDGRRLATSGWDGTVRLADADTGRELLVLRGHGNRVWGVNFSPRGNSLVSASADGKVMLWNADWAGPVVDDEAN